MEKLAKIIERIGLSENESRTYVASLALGESSITDIAKKSAIKRPTTYLALDRLEMLGLVSRIKKGKRNVIVPTHPRRLLQIAKLHENDLTDNMSKFLGLYEDNAEKPKVQMFEGIEAVERIYREAFEQMKEKKEFLFFTNIAAIVEKFSAVENIFPRLLKDHPTIKVRELIYGNAGGKKWISNNKLAKNKSWQARLCPESYPFGENEIMITENTVAFFSAGKNIFVIFIESEDLAKTQKTMFELAWQIGEKTYN
jgi:sugar-specific transcriptional regulator TrmB